MFWGTLELNDVSQINSNTPKRLNSIDFTVKTSFKPQTKSRITVIREKELKYQQCLHTKETKMVKIEKTATMNGIHSNKQTKTDAKK